MPRKRKNEIVHCSHFRWKLICRNGIWYGDGRSNAINPGRHSLGTTDRAEALRLLVQLDLARAVALGLANPPAPIEKPSRQLALSEGRKLYETHINRPEVAGGVRAATAKRYRAPLDKFLQFAHKCGIATWNQVSGAELTKYGAYLKSRGYSQKTQLIELTILKQVVN